MAHNALTWPVPPTDGVTVINSANFVSLDQKTYHAPDFDAGGTWAPAAVIEIGGAGLQIDKLYQNVRVITGVYALDATGPDVVLLANASGANVTITLPAASANRIVKAKLQTGPNILHIAPNGTDTIEGLNVTYNLTQVGSEVTLVGITGGWAIVGKGANRAALPSLATLASAWTAPAGCYWVDIEGCGGGGGGGGGSSGTVATSTGVGGGAGGGGAKIVRQRVPVVPGTAYDVSIGTGGPGGAAFAPGGDGVSTLFSVHGGATIFTAYGGGGGSSGAGPGTTFASTTGGTIANAASNEPGSTATKLFSVASQGGFGTNGIGGSVSTQGSPSDNGNVGGGAGGSGTNSGTTWGGTGGAGGGAGGYGAGATGQPGGGGNAVGGNTGGGGNPGGSATNNSGAGGAGGGGGGCGTVAGGAGGAGGNGGSGKLVIYWVE